MLNRGIVEWDTSKSKNDLKRLLILQLLFEND